MLKRACVFAIALSTIATSYALAAGRSQRVVIPLDGIWSIAQGNLSDQAPTSFQQTVPVPGLVDLAKPGFSDVGVDSAQRKAFWYSRTFRVGPTRRAVAILKITKAQFGTKVWMNGTPVGEHFGCCTPGYFDVSRSLRYGAENRLVVRVGAYKSVLPPTIPVNTDYEQARWIPGIYDSVSLALTDNPYIESVQVAPHIAAGTATVQVRLHNASDTVGSAQVRLSVRQWKSCIEVGEPVVSKVTVGPGGNETVTAEVRVSNAHLWSPEDPFLYVLHCETSGDAVETRFGMREYGYDRRTGKAMLNGRPYYLRGSNFCMFRFFEDPLRGNLPWDHKWVRKLLTTPKKTLHWNSARVCIAPFPEFWYDIADETGWLLQDEFPIWGFHDEWSQDELVSEFGEWMRERWNHPSLAVWDACNETLTPRTGEAISAARDLDLSRRPWDDGYSQRNRPGDQMENHPYSTFPLWSGEGWDPTSLGSPLEECPLGLPKPPLILNEYDAFWMQRQGVPTPCFAKFYNDRVGENATPEQRRELQAYYGAAVTEYWRATRRAAGVDWFCYLTYSRPGGVTGDNFIDLRKQVMSPQFVDYMSNAFSPLAVMVDDTDMSALESTTKQFRVIVTSDLYQRKSGNLLVSFVDRGSGKSVWHTSMPFSVEPLGQSVYKVEMPLPAKAGLYRTVAELQPGNGEKVISRRNVTVLTPEAMHKVANLARGCKVSASSEIVDERGNCPAPLAVDGKQLTRWSSEFADPQWFMIDFGKTERFSRIHLNWEFAYGKTYSIQVSDDAANWRDVYSTDQGHGASEEILFASAEARYVRLLGTERGTRFGYSIFEFQVFEQ